MNSPTAELDPLQLRLINDADKDESEGQAVFFPPLKECHEMGADKFGWKKRTAGIGSIRRDGKISVGPWPARAG